MEAYTKEDLDGALRAVNSLISKCQKAQEKLNHRPAQYTLLKNRIRALEISAQLITKALEEECQRHDL